MLLEHRGDISGVDGDIMSYVSSAEFPPLKHGPSPEAGSSRDKSTLTRKPEEEERHDGIASPPTNLYRSASDINLSSAGDLEQSSFLKAPGMKRVLSETLIARSDNDSQGAEVQEGSDTQQENAVRKSRRRLGRLSIHQPKAAFSKYMVTESASGTEITELPKAHIRTDGNELDSKRKGPSTSLTKLARRSSWILGSRSPSPSNRKTLNGAAKETGKELPLENVDNPGPTSDSVTISPQRKPTSQRSTKSTRRPLSAIIGRSKSAILDENPIPSLPKSLSSDRLPVYTSSTDQVPELPSRDRLQVAPAEAPRKKDELWSHFRSLDAEHQK